MTILIDIDGVLADFGYSYRCWVKSYFNPDLKLFNVGERPFNTWGDPDVTAEQDAKLFKIITDTSHAQADDFWGNIPTLVSRETWERLDELSKWGKIYFVSNRWGQWAHQVTRDWLKRQGIKQPSLVLASRKSLIAIATKAKWALDDKWENVWDMKPYCHACLLERPYNASHRDPSEKVGRVKTVDEFLNLIEKGSEPNVY